MRFLIIRIWMSFARLFMSLRRIQRMPIGITPPVMYFALVSSICFAKARKPIVTSGSFSLSRYNRSGMLYTRCRSGNSVPSSISIRRIRNQAASIISILQERITFFRYLTDSDGSFSFRKFIRDENDRRNLFLMNIRQYDAIFRSLMTFVIDIMTREVLSLSDSFNRRITFVVDEFGSLSKMPCIFDFLTMGRSKGGFLVLANQDLGSVSNIYGADQKETFFNNFNLHLVLPPKRSDNGRISFEGLWRTGSD